MSQNRSRGSRMDETGRSPEAVEHDIERDWGPDAPGVRQDEQLRNAERLPRRGTRKTNRTATRSATSGLMSCGR